MAPKNKTGNVASSSSAAAAAKWKLVTELGPNDVLMGRGALATDYEGNLRLRAMVQSRLDEYTAAPKRHVKHQIAVDIVRAIQATGGRFLQSAETLPPNQMDPALLPRHVAAWVTVPDENVLIAKVKQLLRDVKSPRKKGIPTATAATALPTAAAPRVQEQSHNNNNSSSNNNNVDSFLPPPTKVVLTTCSSSLTSSTTTTHHHQTQTQTNAAAAGGGTSTASGGSDASSAVAHANNQHQRQHQHQHQQSPFDLNFLWQQVAAHAQQEQQQQATTAKPATSNPSLQQTSGGPPPLTLPTAAAATIGAGAGGTSHAQAPHQQGKPPPTTTTTTTMATATATTSPVQQQQQQHQASIAKFTQPLGSDQALTLLQNLTSKTVTREQQYDALLALCMASRLAPQHSTQPVASRLNTGPTPSQQQQQQQHVCTQNRDLTALAAALIEQNQKREREHALANALLAQVLPRIIEGHVQSGANATTATTTTTTTAPPPPPPPPLPPVEQVPSPTTTTSSSVKPPYDANMKWLFEQLQKKNDDHYAAARTEAGLPYKAPPQPAYTDWYAFLRDQGAGLAQQQAQPQQQAQTPRVTGLLEQPNRLAELERLLLHRDASSSSTTLVPSAPVPPPAAAAAAVAQPPESKASVQDGLATLLQALQKQYFPRPKTPP